jgi:hypothetical protein
MEHDMSHFAAGRFLRAALLGALPLWVTVGAFAQSGLPPVPPSRDPPAVVVQQPVPRFAPALPGVAYSHGDPTAKEQFMLELINRARANPAAEGVRLQTTTDPDILGAYGFFGVNLSQMAADFAGYPARPPLAFNANLIAAARGHSQDMAVHDFQDHVGSNGSTFTDRINGAGYTGWNAAGENIYAYADSVPYGHAGFVVDWGVPSLGHRLNIMNFQAGGPVYTEVGIGIVDETSAQTAVGPLVITEDFGRRSGQLFVVGVVYADTDGNGFYSMGEGIAGVTVSTSEGNFAYTSASGGYAIPLVATSGTINVHAEGGALSPPRDTMVPLAGVNVKVDFVAGLASAFSLDYVQKAYVAYYGRPADPAGQAYWAARMDAAGGSLSAIIDAFGNSNEFNLRYGGLGFSALVTKIYQQALARDPDGAGLAYYVGELQAGHRTLQSITVDVLNGATKGRDALVVADKLDVAAFYTAKVAAGCPYGTAADAVALLAAVTDDPATVAAAKAAIVSRCGA